MSDRLKAIRERLEKITPGEWRADVKNEPYVYSTAADGVLIRHTPERQVICPDAGIHANDSIADVRESPDAEFIAASPADIRWLVSEVERLSRIEAAAVAYRDCRESEMAAVRENVAKTWVDRASDRLDAQKRLFATLPSSEETSRG